MPQAPVSVRCLAISGRMGLLKMLSWLAAPTLRSRFNLSFYAYSIEGGFTGRHQLEQGATRTTPYLARAWDAAYPREP